MIIGIGGRKFSGKDTVSDFLSIECGFIKYSLADPLKRGIQEMFGLSNDQLWGKEKDVVDEYWGVKPRDLLQFVGTDLLLNQLHKYVLGLTYKDRNLWLKRFEKWLISNNIDISTQNIVISDVRFEHEVNYIKNMGGMIIKIDRLGVDTSDNHPSESSSDKLYYDYILKNDKGIDYLKSESLRIVNMFTL